MKSTTTKNRSFWRSVLAAAVALAIGVIWLPGDTKAQSQSSAKEMKTATLGWVKSTSNLLAYLAPQFSERHGLKLKLVYFTNAQDILTALINGQLDIGLLTPIHFIRGIEGRINLIQVAGNARGGNGIVVSRKLGLAANDWDGMKRLLKERKLRLAAFRGSVNEMLAIGEFAKHGIILDKAFDVTNLTNPGQHPQALRSGEFDMIVTLEPLASLVVADGTGTMFSHGYDTAAGDINTDFVARGDWVAKEPKLAQAFVSALADAEKLLKNDKKAEMDAAIKLTGLPPNVIKLALSNMRYELRNGVPEMQALAKIALEHKYVKRDVSKEIPKHVTDKFLVGAGIKP